jgi:hypothetical protein
MPSIPIFTFITGSFCRTGPGTAYPETTGIQAGDTVEIVGRNADNTWYYIFWKKFSVKCWVSSSTGQTSGDLLRVPIQAVAPAPEPPIIQSASADPNYITYPGCGPSQSTFTAVVVDNQGVASVALRYQLNNGPLLEKPMFQIGNSYQTTLDAERDALPVPPYPNPAILLEWFVEAQDTSGLLGTSEKQTVFLFDNCPR